jgi:hypothetical protein
VTDLKVVYIVGPGRSGSTLFGDILAQTPSVVHVGELFLYWKRRTLVPASRCGCGLPIPECPFWTSVTEYSKWATDVDVEMADEIYALGSSRHWPGLWWRGRSGQEIWPNFSDRLAKLYEAIAEVSGARVIIDSSKQPGPALVLANLEGVDPYFIHLTRDPRAVVRSWKTAKHDALSPTDALEALPPVRVTLNWSARALAAELLVASRAGPTNYKRLAWESFVQSPREAYRDIMQFIGEPPASSAFVDDHSVQVAPSHTIAGNPGRREGGVRRISLDETWREELTSKERVAIAAASAPMMLKLGYPLDSRVH